MASSALITTENDNAQATNCTSSSLRVLEVCVWLNDIQGVLQPLTTKESQLEELSLGGLIESTCSQLAQFVPELIRLRELKLVFLSIDHQNFDSQSWLRVLRKNGSLHDMSFSYKNDAREHVPMFGLEYSKIQSLCDRNRWAPGMLQAAGSNKSTESPTPMSLFPALCMVLAQSPRLAPTFLLAGMLAAGDWVVCRQKRVCSSMELR
jgi:hypothetical protein